MTTRKHAVYGILALVSLLGLGITQSARANYIVTLEQIGSNVVANGSGPINLTGLTFLASGNPGRSHTATTHRSNSHGDDGLCERYLFQRIQWTDQFRKRGRYCQQWQRRPCRHYWPCSVQLFVPARLCLRCCSIEQRDLE